MFVRALGVVIFALLVFKGISFINFEAKSYTQLYTSSWNVSLEKLNAFQTLLFGQQKIDFSFYKLTTEAALKQFMTNIGLIYVIAGFSILYRAYFVRYVSGLIFFVIFITYGLNKKQFDSTDYLEKYYHFALTLVFFLYHQIEPRLYSEKKVVDLMIKQKEDIFKQIEEGRAKKAEKNKIKQEAKQQPQAEHHHSQNNKQVHHHEEKVEKEEIEEEEEELVAKVDHSKKGKQQQEVNEFDSDEQEEKRKYQVDDDGFSVVPKKNIKKVQENRKAAQQKKKQLYDI